MSPVSTRTPQSASLSPCLITCTRPSSPRTSEKLPQVSATAPSLRVLSGTLLSDGIVLCPSRSLALIGPWHITARGGRERTCGVWGRPTWDTKWMPPSVHLVVSAVQSTQKQKRPPGINPVGCLDLPAANVFPVLPTQARWWTLQGLNRAGFSGELATPARLEPRADRDGSDLHIEEAKDFVIRPHGQGCRVRPRSRRCRRNRRRPPRPAPSSCPGSP